MSLKYGLFTYLLASYSLTYLLIFGVSYSILGGLRKISPRIEGTLHRLLTSLSYSFCVCWKAKWLQTFGG